ncbi:hypothetical protein [Mesorhizobium sp. Z1-4]|uniref:hypothetical protein n=1 Tax=Mesorhizobium sp. Z1-4 TaxID=2448478 RepID=UPI000FD99554|nr:hypothetical protein [Mesorhizobium sp. Z1-4]
MPDDVKLDDKALAKANEAAAKAWPPTYSHASHIEAAIRAYLGALPSLPSDIDGLVAKYARSAQRNALEMSTMPLSVIEQHFREFLEEATPALRARQAPEPFGDGYCTDCGNRTVMTDGRCSCGSGRVIADRYAPEGVVEDIKAAMSAAIWNDFLYDIDKMVYGEGSRLPDQNDAAKLAEIAYRAALSAMPSGAVKEFDLSNLLKHAFLSGVVAARSIPPGDECRGPALWVDYDPEGCPAFARIRSALEGVAGGAGWQPIDTAPKGCVTEDAGCRGNSEWFLGRTAKKFRKIGTAPIVVIRRRPWPQEDRWADNGETHYVPDYFDAWMPLSSALEGQPS